jgi:ferritin-like metal-binding protein YciE
MATTIEDQLVTYLTDAHTIEEQALVQMRIAPRLAGDRELAQAFRAHQAETEAHRALVDGRLAAHGGSPSAAKDLVSRAGGLGMALFARLKPDTPGILAAHAYSYENMEAATYELLARVARRAGDESTVEVAGRILEQERAMAARISDRFDRAEEAALRAVGAEDLQEQLVKYLEDAHALEQQAIKLLQKAPEIAGGPELAAPYREHLEESREHERLVRERLEAHGARPSALKDLALSAGALQLGLFMQAQPDTPSKLAGFAYAFEHLEIASYELLRRLARRAGDEETVAVAERILAQEHAAADRLHAGFDAAADRALQEAGAGG